MTAVEMISLIVLVDFRCYGRRHESIKIL